MFERLRKAQAQLPYLPESLRLIWGAARTWTLAWSGLLVLQGLLPIALVYLTGAFVDSLSASIQAKEWSVYTRSIQWVGLIALLLLVRQSLESLTAWVRTVQAELVQDHVYELIHAKAIELDLSFYDSPEYYDRLHRARMDAYDRPVALLENIGALIQNALTFLAMAGLLSRFAWWLPIVLLAGMAPALGVVTQHAFLLSDFHAANSRPAQD